MIQYIKRPKFRMYSTLLCLLITLIPLFSRAQRDSITLKKEKNPVMYEVELENGGILKQSALRDNTYKNAYYQGANIRVGWKQYSSDDKYNALYNNPIYGVGIYSGTFDNDIIGNPFAVYGFVQVPLFEENLSNRWSFDYRIGLGLSGNFKPYDKIANPLNLAIGSSNNVFIDFGLRAQYRLHDKWKLGVGVSFHHFSNGAISLPNRGINLVPVTVSISYQPKMLSALPRVRTEEQLDGKWTYDLNLGVGVKQLDVDKGQRFIKTTLGLYASRHVHTKWRLGAGLDLFYSDSGNDREIAGKAAESLSALFSGGPSFYMVHVLNEQLELTGNIGYYLHRQYFNGEVNNIFLRAGARYYVYKNFNAGVSIKAHMGKADFVEWSLGYTLNK